jgi:hypothetical protein
VVIFADHKIGTGRLPQEVLEPHFEVHHNGVGIDPEQVLVKQHSARNGTMSR